MINVTAIYGSPRQNGNSGLLVQEVLKGIKSEEKDVQTKEIYPTKLNIQPCLACEKCFTKQGCVIKDDMRDLFIIFDNSDLIIVASPVYFNAVTAQLKGLIDRCQAIWASKYILKKPIIDRSKYRLGTFIATAGSPQNVAKFEPSKEIIDLFFKAINTQYYSNLFVAGLDQLPVENRADILMKAYEIGKKMVISFKNKKTF